jgi:hypothetical protein
VGAPIGILRQILDHFSGLGGVSVVANGENRIVPVYLLDDVSHNPEGFSSGCCDDSHLTTVRNSCPYFLALIPPHKLENRSISSSTTLIGGPQHHEVQKWSEHSLIDGLIWKALASKGCVREVFEDCVDRVLKDAETLDEHLNDRTWQWRILEVLFNVGHSNNERYDEVVAACGLPRLSLDKDSIASAQRIMGLIAEKMLSDGLGGFFERLSGSLESIFLDQQDKVGPVRLALEELSAHLLRWVDNAPQFESAARVYYSPYRTCESTSELPAWWKTLSVDVWEKLLEEEEEEPEEELNVELENALFYPKRGIHMLLEISLHSG